MLVSGQGVVLNSLRYGETSVITKILTKDHGVVPFMIQGVYRKKARISYSQLQPFSLLEMVYYYKENRQMQKVKEVKVQPALNNLQTNVAKTAVALFAVEVLNNVISDNEPDEFLYPWLEGFVLDLDHAAKVDPFISHIFLIQLASQLGFAPSAEGIGQYFNMEEGRFSELTPNFRLRCWQSGFCEVWFGLANSDWPVGMTKW